MVVICTTLLGNKVVKITAKLSHIFLRSTDHFIQNSLRGLKENVLLIIVVVKVDDTHYHLLLHWNLVAALVWSHDQMRSRLNCNPPFIADLCIPDSGRKTIRKTCLEGKESLRQPPGLRSSCLSTFMTRPLRFRRIRKENVMQSMFLCRE